MVPGRYAGPTHPGRQQVEKTLTPGIELRRGARFGARFDRGHFSSEVQLGQRVALREMLEKQNGQSLVVTAAGWAFCSLLMALISRNTAKATIRKLTTELMNRP